MSDTPKSIHGLSGDVWLKYCRLVFENGNDFFDEDQEIMEMRNVLLTFRNLDTEDPIFVKLGEKHIVSLYRRKMQTTEIIPELNSSYGKRLFDQQGFDQILWVVDRLTSKPETKAATISLLLPDDPGPRIPCLCTLDFKIRDGKLRLTGFFRSQNIINSYANFISIRDLQYDVASKLGIVAGEMTFLISSAHYYKKDSVRLNNVLSFDRNKI